MTWAATIANGRGEVSYRLSIERLSTQFVTHPSMETATRKPWLSLSGKLKCMSNPIAGEIDVSGLRVSIIDPQGGATAIFARAPEDVTWLTANFTAAATTMTVRSTAGWATSGYVYLDSEVISYAALGGAPGVTFTGCTRGALSSLAQSHYISTAGGATRYPEATSSITSIAGCRARIYAYGQNDDPQGDGTQIWLGVVTRHPSLSGPAWTFMLDPITSVLSKTLSSDLQQSAQPRGIKYDWQNTFRLVFQRFDTGERVTCDVPVRADSDVAFFENNEEFAEDINAKLATLITAAGWDVDFSAVIRVIPTGDSGWYLGFTSTATVEVQVIECSGVIDPVFSGAPTDITGTVSGLAGSGVEVFWLPTSDSLVGAGSVPRGYIGASSIGVGGDESAADVYPINKVYLSGVALSSSIDAVAIKWQEFGPYPEEETTPLVLSSDTATNSAMLDIAMPPGHPTTWFTAHAWTAATAPEFRFGRTYTQNGNIYTALVRIASLAPSLLNLGAVPDLRSGDLDGSSWNLIDGDDQPRIVSSRRFTSFSDVELLEVVKHELLLAGFMLGTDETGKIAIAPIRGVVATELADITIDNVIDVPTWEPTAYGMVNQVSVARGYLALEDEYVASTVLVRNQAEFGRNPNPRTASIEPKSAPSGPTETYDECVEVAQRIFSAYAGPYAIINAKAPLTAYNLATVGAVVSLTSPHIPNYEDGTVGVTGLKCIVTGREVDLKGGTIGLRLYASTASTSGYVPEALITAESNVSGDIWDLTLDSQYFPAASDAADWFIVGDLVTARRWDSTSTTTIVGTVTVATAYVIRVSFTTSGAALASDEWFLTARVASDALSTTQDDYVYLADSTMVVDFDGTNRAARRFA